MNKRFLISEDDREHILSLYAKKGIVLEQDRTNQNIQTKNNDKKIYKLGGYDLEVDGNQNIKVFDRYMGNNKFMGEFSGKFSDLKYNLETNSFADSNKVLSQDNLLLLKMLPNIREKQTPSNNLGYFVALSEKNGFPTLYALTPIVVKQVQEIPVVDSTVIGLNQSYIPTRQTYGSMKDEIIKASKGVKKDYSDLNFRKFIRRYAISLNTIAGPQGTGIVNPPTPPTPTPTPPPSFVPRSVGGNEGEPFKFNKTVLAADGEKQLNDFINQFIELKQRDPDLYNTYIDYLKRYYGENGKINVYAYSSIDDDPEQTITYVEGTNAVEGCGGTMKRKDYNLCLSKKRAEIIATKLNEDLPDFPDFIGIGKGESKSVNGVGWTKEKPTKDIDTLPNRRFDVELPEYSDRKSTN